MTVQEWLGKDNQIGIDIWTKKYRQDNESFDEWLDRVSGGNQALRQLIIEKKFLFGGRILSNRGMAEKGEKGSLSNCYVITPPEDNIESIFDCAKKLARTYSYGGGCGTDLSKLAPKGAKVHNTAKETSGAVSFMDLYSLVTGLIGQNGRRGALMLSLSCAHPDLEEFIDIKSDLNKVTKANISIRITNEFMNAVVNNTDYTLSFKREATGEVITRIVNARQIFRKIAEANWNYAEPGALFWDRIERWNLLCNTKEFEYAGTNPCAEEPLPAGGSCLLGALILSSFVKNGEFDYVAFAHAVKTSVEALNEVLDEGMPLHPLEEQRESVSNWRQIGLGVFGVADMLIKMKIRFGSEESLMLCDKIGYVMAQNAIEESARLANLYGAFPKCNVDEITHTPYYLLHATNDIDNMVLAHGLRNSQLLTIAPTGTISTMLGVSGGLEPIFANYYERKTESLHSKDVYYKIYTPIVKEYMDANKITDDSKLPDYFITAQNLNYVERLRMQAVWQKHIDASISSTVNVPNNFTIEDTEKLYISAWEQGLKGVTIYREGCKRSGVLSTKPDKGEILTPAAPKLGRGDIIETSDYGVGKKRKLSTGCGSLHCTAFFDPESGDLLETYFSKGSSGGCNNFMIGLSRMISLTSRSGTDIKEICDQLASCGTCPSYAVRTATKRDTSKGACCPAAIGIALMDMWTEMQSEINSYDEEIIDEENYNYDEFEEEILEEEACEECGEKLIFSGGCNSCPSCGWSKCK